jgi:hypothetical protein
MIHLHVGLQHFLIQAFDYINTSEDFWSTGMAIYKERVKSRFLLS